MCRLSVQSLDRCTSGQCCLTKQRDERFVSIQVLCHRLLKHDVLKDVAVDGGKSSLREMHSHHSIHESCSLNLDTSEAFDRVSGKPALMELVCW